MIPVGTKWNKIEQNSSRLRDRWNDRRSSRHKGRRKQTQTREKRQTVWNVDDGNKSKRDVEAETARGRETQTQTSHKRRCQNTATRRHGWWRSVAFSRWLIIISYRRRSTVHHWARGWFTIWEIQSTYSLLQGQLAPKHLVLWQSWKTAEKAFLKVELVFI